MVVAALALCALAVAASADAHGGDESQEGFVLVQQALAHLAHETNHDGIQLALEKVDDALATSDQEGVGVAAVEQAKRALESGRVQEARTLLQHSITKALAERPPATGYQSGTGLVASKLPGRRPVGAGDWLVLGLSVAVGALGVWLSVRFRPHESVTALQLLLGTKPTTKDGER